MRKFFRDSVTPLPIEQGLAPQGMVVNSSSDSHKDDSMSLLFALDIPEDKVAALRSKVASGQTITPEELASDYSAPTADLEKLVGWLKTQGYDVTEVSPDKTSVYASTTVANIEKTLEVHMVRVTKGGISYNAAQNAPSLPSEVAEGVHAIIGLQPFRRAQKHFRRFVPDPEPTLAVNAAAASVLSPPYHVDHILGAYNGSNLQVDGAGQVIAIVIDTVPADDDLVAFWQKNGVNSAIDRIEKINVLNRPLPPVEGEETLDVQWCSGIAPGAKIRVYASGTLRFVDLDKALDKIIADVALHPTMRQLSISLGLGETFMGGPDGEVKVQSLKFLKLAALGVNVFVSSGDAGSNPDQSGHNSGGALQCEYEASDPSVVAVGGTTLRLSGQGSVTSETAWAGSGGGKSIFFNRPEWQTGAGFPAGLQRCVPDVSAAANPDTGALVILNGQEQQIGGTSWSAPVWAGICALMNHARQKAGKDFLPFLNPIIYPLQGTACFRDINGGSNGAFQAKQGYDLVTGLGSPNIKELIKAVTT